MKTSFGFALILFCACSSFLLTGCTGNSTQPANPTPTPGPFPGVTFNSKSTVSNWTLNSYPFGLSGAITFNPTFSACSGSTGAMEATIGFTAIQEQIELLGILPSTYSLSGQGVTCILEFNGGWNSDSEQLSAQLYLVQAQGTYGSSQAPILMGNIFDLSSAPSSSASGSGCVTLSFAMPSGAVTTGTYANYQVYNGTFNLSEVSQIGINISTGMSGSGFGNTVVDIKNWI